MGFLVYALGRKSGRGRGMTLILDLTPDQERRLRREAEQRGLKAEEYARRLFDKLVFEDSDDAWEVDLDALAEGHERMPVLSPEATTRDRIYGERG
jgi:hypothetical protein